MLDKRFIREHPDEVKAAVRVKGINLDVDELLKLDQASRELQHKVDDTQALRKSSAGGAAAASEERRAYLRSLGDDVKRYRAELAETNEKLTGLLLRTPTIPWDGAPVGPDESANVVIRTVGTPPEFSFRPLDHVELLEKRGWADFSRARKVAGERAYALISDLVLLERAVHSYALDLLRGKDFTLVSVPSLVREQALIGTGMFPAHREETYSIPADDLYLAGTAEVALVGFHSDEILDVAQLPIRYAGISPCFRREAGQRRPGRPRAAASPSVREGRAVRHLRGRPGGVRQLARRAARHGRAAAGRTRPGLRGDGGLHRRHGRGQVPDERHQHLAALPRHVP